MPTRAAVMGSRDASHSPPSAKGVHDTGAIFEAQSRNQGKPPEMRGNVPAHFRIKSALSGEDA
jgi:hypothetical protein